MPCAELRDIAFKRVPSMISAVHGLLTQKSLIVTEEDKVAWKNIFLNIHYYICNEEILKIKKWLYMLLSMFKDKW
jgi:hypothetical protein